MYTIYIKHIFLYSTHKNRQGLNHLHILYLYLPWSILCPYNNLYILYKYIICSHILYQVTYQKGFTIQHGYDDDILFQELWIILIVIYFSFYILYTVTPLWGIVFYKNMKFLDFHIKKGSFSIKLFKFKEKVIYTIQKKILIFLYLYSWEWHLHYYRWIHSRYPIL